MESIGDLIGWMFLFVFGIWIGSLVNTFYIKKIYDEISKLNRGSGQGTRDGFHPKEEEEEEVKYGVKYKYCFHGCSSPIDDTLKECPACSGHSFVYRKPEETKKVSPRPNKLPRRTGHDNTWPPR